MTRFNQLKGVIAAALTPLNMDFSPALKDVPVILEFLAERGCHGALLLGTTGEGPSFSPDERLQILKAALPVRDAHPEFHLLAGTGTPSLAETIGINKSMFELGVDGVVVLPPYYFRKVSEQGIFDWYSQVILNSVPSGAAFLLYNIPGLTGINLSLDLIERLLQKFPDRSLGIKDSTNDPEFARNLGERFGHDLLVFNGTDSLFDLALESCAAGCITAMANLRSPDLRLVWEARKDGRVNIEARSRLEKARMVMDRYPPNPPLYKALVHRLHHLPKWPVRPPLIELPVQQIQEILEEAVLEVPEFIG
jgi:4-hydroxy-tetrahydrodipicolinate synthase